MPSNKDPKSTVASGAGKLSAGVVNATALTFPLSQGSGAQQASSSDSSYYLFDAFTSTLSASPIIDVVESPTGQVAVNGAFVVRVPSNVRMNVTPPLTLSNVLTAKYAGLLAKYASFGHIVFDDMTTSSGVDFTANPVGVFGSRGNVGITSSTILQTTAVALGSTPTSAVLTWELFTYSVVDPKADRLTRTYNQVASTTGIATVTASFNGGSTYNATTDGAPITISGGDQGSTFIMKLTNISGARLYVGSWSLVY